MSDAMSERERLDLVASLRGAIAGMNADPLPTPMDPTWWKGYASGLRLRYVRHGDVSGLIRDAEKTLKWLNRCAPSYLREEVRA